MSAHVYGKPALSISDVLISQATSRLGGLPDPDPKNVSWFFDDLIGSNGNSSSLAANWNLAVVGSGAATQLIVDEGGGVHQLATGATGASSAAADTLAPMIRRVDNQAWWMAFRMKVTTAIDAAAKVYCGVSDIPGGGTKSIAIGVFGANSTVNFVLQYDGNEAGSFVSTGVAIDTSFHVFEVWTTGDGKLHMAVDFGADITPSGTAMVAATTNAVSLRRSAQNGATAAARTSRVDWAACISKRS